MKILIFLFSDDADVYKADLVGDIGGTCISNMRFQIDSPEHGVVTDADREVYSQISEITPAKVDWYWKT